MTTAPVPTSNDLAQQRTTLADDRTSLALDRTRLAHERTLMAWVRTAVSLISFGFTIYKFFQGLHEAERVETARHLFGRPRLRARDDRPRRGLAPPGHESSTPQRCGPCGGVYPQYGPMPRSTSMVVATVVVTLGILALILVILRQ